MTADTPTMRDAIEAARTAIRARWPIQIAPNTATAVAKVAVEAATPILRAANELVGCCRAAVDSDGHTHAETCVYLLGLREGRAEGRVAAAEDIRAVDASVLNGYCADVAARVAENGVDHVRD